MIEYEKSAIRADVVNGFYKETIPKLNKMIAINSKDTDLFNWLGLCLLHTGCVYLAITEFIHAIKVDKNYVKAWMNLSVCHAQIDDNESALADLLKASEIDDSQATIYYNLGFVYEKLGNHNLAKDSYEKALKREENINTLIVLANLCSRNLDSPEEAMGYYFRVLELDSGNFAALTGLNTNLPKLAEDTKALEKMLNYFSEALDYDNENIDYMLYKAHALYYLNQFDESKKILKKILALDPLNDQAAEMMGAIDF